MAPGLRHEAIERQYELGDLEAELPLFLTTLS